MCAKETEGRKGMSNEKVAQWILSVYANQEINTKLND